MLSFQPPLCRSFLFLPSLQIAHFSDPHLPLVGLPALREIRFKRMLSLLSWRLKRRHMHLGAPLAVVMQDIGRHNPDLVALTGDLTNLGLASEFEAATRWLQAQDLPDTLLVPGNHDALIRENAESKSVQWAPWLQSQTGFPSLLKKGSVALIGLNSATPTPPFFASGRVSETQLDALGGLLRQTGEKGLCRIVLIHHPPVQGLVSKRKGLDGVERLQAILKREGAELVLHGHSHRATLSNIPHTHIPVVGTTSASHSATTLVQAAGWNCISVLAEANHWQISIQRRELGANGRMQDGFLHHFSPHRLSCTKAL
ncbi:metallophosphoesterase [Acetobacter tropicalis]|uniref:Putative phosphohydrolase, Icc family n=1 Tax=Acetobacter tropicalis TaxID=104102 RepID=A0A094ZIH9_9PROT|nr:metallophosphoesterase [Acetobacter tropicalis]KAA8390192.1 metallophosphoesterase [Acetobacter tropicalis]KAA8391898.1 metallophosphoesterase [Acetobacter tropicalis]KGB22276.1 putative phosphohydrolase, Icc family [Acetobacter tropicalis]MBC9007774.1 metallophosphoesterase [Acetobacter tropicalis]MDO8172956.1 metallophosphoesterase [Acetobacter tropicalis]